MHCGGFGSKWGLCMSWDKGAGGGGRGGMYSCECGCSRRAVNDE